MTKNVVLYTFYVIFSKIFVLWEKSVFLFKESLYQKMFVDSKMPFLTAEVSAPESQCEDPCLLLWVCLCDNEICCAYFLLSLIRNGKGLDEARLK